MKEPKSPGAHLSHDSQGRSALDDGMDRVCEKLDEEKAVSVKLSTKHRLPKVVRRRLIPLKGENPAASPLSSHFPWIRKHPRPLSKSLR